MATRRPGLYHPDYEHDSCGFGLIAQIDDRASARVVIDGVRCARTSGASRRGRRGRCQQRRLRIAAVSPRCVVACARGRERDRARREHSPPGSCSFRPIPHWPSARSASSIVELADERLAVAGWRDVPIDASVCGPEAARSFPRIAQIFVNAPDESAPRSALRARAVPCAPSRDERAGRRRAFLRGDACRRRRSATRRWSLPGALRACFRISREPSSRRVRWCSTCASRPTRCRTGDSRSRSGMLAHNGEINTIRGQPHVAAARARQIAIRR